MNRNEQELIKSLIPVLKHATRYDETKADPDEDPADMRGRCDTLFRLHPDLEHRLGLLSGRDVPKKISDYMDWTESAVYRKREICWYGLWSIKARPLTHCQLLFYLLSCMKKSEFI